MLDTAAMQDEFEEVADTPIATPRITERQPSRLAPTTPAATAPAQSNLAWATPKNLIYIGLGVVSTVIAIAAVVNSQPKPAERIDPFVPKSFDQRSEELLQKSLEGKKISFSEAKAGAKAALDKDTDAAIKILANDYLQAANKAVKDKNDKDCLRSEKGIDCDLNRKRDAWLARQQAASRARDAKEMILANANLLAIEAAREGRVELVETAPEVVRSNLDELQRIRLDLIESSPNAQAGKLNKKL